MTTRIIFPNLRYDIETSLKRLLDKEEQKGWFDPNCKHAFSDSLYYYVFEFLFDTIDIDEPEEQIGVTLYNKEEADTIAKFLNFYNDTFKADMPDSYYINHPKWSKLLEEAKKIIEIMKENNKEYNLKKDIELWEKEVEERRIKEGRCW